MGKGSESGRVVRHGVSLMTYHRKPWAWVEAAKAAAAPRAAGSGTGRAAGDRAEVSRTASLASASA
eukprot:scaffold19207_cov146-Isochrysis_galbana.AAC.1